MPSDGAPPSGWALSDDPGEVHDLLCSSDRHAAQTYRSPLPRRRRETTDRLVRDGSVHVLREGGEVVAMFTLTRQAPYPLDDTGFPHRAHPAYLQRLVVRPDLLRAGSLLGPQCVIRAIEVATAAGSDALRSEANPDLRAVLDMLRTLGFAEYGRPPADGPVRRVYLQRDLRPHGSG